MALYAGRYDEVLLRRLSGRRTCRDCDKVANIHHPEFDPGEVCEVTGKAHDYFQRSDDTEETIAKRLEVYAAQTEPLVDYYRAQGKLISVAADGSIESVYARMTSALETLDRDGVGDAIQVEVDAPTGD